MRKPLAMLLSAMLLPGMSLGAGLPAEPAATKAVLVTGASSGIGRKITERLAAEGYYVYAGARKAADLKALDALDNVSAVRLDVTVPADIAAAVEFVRAGGRGLHGVVNNAGVGVFSPMNETSEDDIHFVMNVNVLGPYRINKAFTPLLAEYGGRTTTIGSISGFLAGPQSGTYSMSKFAVEAYTDSLAAELEPLGVHVSVVEPGGYRSEIREKVARRQLGIGSRDVEELSEDERRMLEQTLEANESLKEPDEVADAVLRALFEENPKRRYMVTPNREQAAATIRGALSRVVQLNADQPYEYSRDELVTLLDELLAEQAR